MEDNPIIMLETVGQLEELLEQSSTKTVFLFKNSTQCGISAKAKQDFQTFVVKHEENKDFVFAIVDVIEHRDVSDRIEELLEVEHESPQLIIVKKGKQVFNTSHWDITLERIEENVSE